MPDIAIVGGGIGGLCTAIALLDRGFDPVVYEATDELQHVGAGIAIPPNGLQKLDQLNVLDAVVDRGVILDSIELRTNDRTLMSMDLDEPSNNLDRSVLSVHRAALQAALVDRLPSETLQLGMECSDISINPPTIQFCDGSSITARVVVGADGVNSAVRRCLSPYAKPQFTNEIGYHSIVDGDIFSNLKTGLENWSRGARFGFAPISNEQTYCYASVRASSPDAAPEMTPRDLAVRYEWPEDIDELLKHSTGTTIRAPIFSLPTLSRWSRGRVTLLGDAAHAMEPYLAQGCSQAIADAIALAKSVSQYGTTHRAISAYEDRRKPRTDAIRHQSRCIGLLGQIENPALKGVRDASISLTSSLLS